jgi:AraC family transcriptional regulator, exoenzyme S synthesis regulatory protein ExsA
MRSIKLDFGVTFFEKKNSDSLNRIGSKKKVELFDFGSNNSYFLISLEHHRDLQALVSTLHDILDGNYYWITITQKTTLLFYFGINSHWLSKQAGHFTDVKNIMEVVLTNWNDNHSLFNSKFIAFYKEYQRNSNQELLVKSYFLQFLYFLVNDILTETLRRNSQDIREIELQTIKAIEEKITHEVHKSIPSVKEMAKMAGVSVSKFKLLFYELYGTSPHQHILDKKMMYAKGLLQTGKYSITQVAYKVGYLHLSGFVRIYKQKFNHSPNTTYFEKQ